MDYKEHWVEGSESLEAYNKENDTNFTEDMVNENGDVCIGGFGDDYGIFEDVSEYFLAEKETDRRLGSLAAQIESAEGIKSVPPSVAPQDLSDREER